MNTDQRKEELYRTLRENHFTPSEVEEAISHHLKQLSRLGATLEDNVCSILRKAKAQAEARQELEQIEEKLSTDSFLKNVGL